MYACVCNGIRECDLRQAALLSDGDVEAVYARLGKRPQCGQCLPASQDLIDDVRATARLPVLRAA